MTPENFDVSAAIHALVPNARCVVWENSIEGIAWEDERPQPSPDEIRAVGPAIAVSQRITKLKKASGDEARRRMAALSAGGDGDQVSALRAQVMLLGRALKMARREATARATPAEKAALDQLETMMNEHEAIDTKRIALDAAIASGTVTTEAQVLDPARW